MRQDVSLGGMSVESVYCLETSIDFSSDSNSFRALKVDFGGECSLRPVKKTGEDLASLVEVIID